MYIPTLLIAFFSSALLVVAAPAAAADDEPWWQVDPPPNPWTSNPDFCQAEDERCGVGSGVCCDGLQCRLRYRPVEECDGMLGMTPTVCSLEVCGYY